MRRWDRMEDVPIRLFTPFSAERKMSDAVRAATQIGKRDDICLFVTESFSKVLVAA